MDLKNKLSELREINLNYLKAYGELYDAIDILPEDVYDKKLDILEQAYKEDIQILNLRYEYLFEQQKYALKTQNDYLSPWRFLFFKNKIAKIIESDIGLDALSEFAGREIDYSKKYENYQNTYQTEEPEIQSDEPKVDSGSGHGKRLKKHNKKS